MEGNVIVKVLWLIKVSHLFFFVFFSGPPPFGSSWVKRYCTFIKEQKILNMVTFDQRSGGKFVSQHRTQDENCDHLLGPQEFLRCFPSVFSGWDGVCHTQIMSSQNNWHAGPEVLLRPWHNWPVYTLFFFFTLYSCICVTDDWDDA